MKDRISQIAKGEIVKTPPAFRVTPEAIERTVTAGKSVSCDLMIRSQGDFPVKGLVLASDPHLDIGSGNGFSGYVCRVSVEIRTGAGESEKTIEGQLTVVTEAGEMGIPYSISIVSAEETQRQLPKTAEEFARIAQSDWEEGEALFVSPLFSRCAFFSDLKLYGLYQGLIRGTNPAYALESFLTALGWKNAAVIEVENVTEETSCEIDEVVFRLSQKEWGYAEITGSTRKESAKDESFLPLSRKWTTADLTEEGHDGVRCAYVAIPVRKERLHGGCNEAVVEWSDGKRVSIHPIRIQKGSGRTAEYVQMQSDKASMMQAIAAVLAGKTRKNAGRQGKRWREEGIHLAELSQQLWERYPQKWSLPLIQAAGWMEAGERERAMALLHQVKGSIFSRRYEEPRWYQLELYLEEALSGSESDQRGCQALRDDYKRNKDPLVFFYLAEIDPQWIGKPGKILKELESFFHQGIHSPLLYWKACQVLCSIPDFLHIENAFQRQALYFGVNYDCLSLEVMVQAASQVLEEEKPHWFMFHMLSRMYGRTQNRTILEAVIAVLISHDKRSRNFFSWYELGMKENFNRQGLARFYLLSAPDASYQPFLKQVLLYYSYDDNLEAALREKLYTNVYQFYRSDKRICGMYDSRIEKFMAEQILQGNISDNLAYLYRCMIHPDLVDRRMAEQLIELLHMKRVIGLDFGTRYLIVRYPQLDIEKKIPCFCEGDDFEKMANAPLHSDQVLLFQEDAEGKRSVLSRLQARPWLSREDLEAACQASNPSHFGIQVPRLQRLADGGLKKEEDASQLLWLAEQLPVSAPFVDWIVQEMAAFCYDHPEYEGGDGILLGLDISTLDAKRQQNVMRMLIAKGFLEKARENVKKIGWEGLDLDCRKQFFSLWYENSPGEGADWRMTALAKSIVWEDPSFREGLEYLCAFYTGSQEEMAFVLQNSIQAGCSVYRMPERLLVQSIFSGMWERLDLFFSWYLQLAQEPDLLLMRAAYAILCHQYFALQNGALEQWMREPFLERLFEKNPPLICILAKLSYLSEQTDWTDSMRETAEALIPKLLEKELYFAFYHKLFEQIPAPVWLEGRVILEYRGPAQRKIILEYERIGWDTEKNSIRMEEEYPGIYTQQVLLFADEKLVLRMEEELEGIPHELLPPRECRQKPFETAHSHLAALNRIARLLEEKQADNAIAEINKMEEEKKLMEALFPIQQEE